MKLHQFSSWIVLYCRMFYLRGVRFIFNEHYLVLKSISLNSRFDNLPSLLSSLRSNTASIWSGSALLFYVTSYSRPTCDLVSLVVELSISFLVMYPSLFLHMTTHNTQYTHICTHLSIILKAISALSSSSLDSFFTLIYWIFSQYNFLSYIHVKSQ